MIDNEVKKIDNSFCFFTIGDITTKENRLVDLLLSLFNYNYYSIDNIVDNYNTLEPLSIINKVIGYGIKNIVIDIKTGFRINNEEAKKLANEFLELSRKYEVTTTCFITSLNLSLGTSFGRNLETIEIANLLEGKEYSSLLKLAIKITSFMIDKDLSLEKNQALIIEYIKRQHENLAFSKKLNINNLDLKSRVFSIKSSKTGFVKNIDVFEIEDLLNKLGFDDQQTGIVFSKQIGDYVLENEELAKVYLNEKDILASEVLDCFQIELEMGKIDPLVKEIVR